MGDVIWFFRLEKILQPSRPNLYFPAVCFRQSCLTAGVLEDVVILLTELMRQDDGYAMIALMNADNVKKKGDRQIILENFDGIGYTQRVCSADTHEKEKLWPGFHA